MTASVGKRVRAGTGRILWAAVGLGLITPAAAVAALISVGGISVSELAGGLQQSPVQQRGHPNPQLTAAQVRKLDARIRSRDRGRIWIAVLTPLSETATGDITRALADAINSDGVYIVVAGSNYHVTTTWETGTDAEHRLAAAVNRPGDSLYVQMRRTIDSFAAADAAAGHPGAASTEQTGPGSTSGPASSGGAGGGGGGSGGLIVGLVVVAVTLGTLGWLVVRRLRGSMQVAHYRKEESADVHAQAQADFVKLGDDIGALDIDTSMPHASQQGKDEYAKTLDCYQDAEQRLKHADDAYQFERAQDALRRGAQHIQAAQQLLSAAPSAVDDGLVDRISKLAELRKQGALTDAEFAAEKHKLLGD